MSSQRSAASRRSFAGNREGAGFVASLAFVGLASVRDVYLAGLFQRVSPLTVASVAFALCSLVFLPIALGRDPASLRRLLARPRELFWINATSALAWISFFYALRTIEPLLVQILFAGVGPLSVTWIDRWVPGGAATVSLTRVERSLQRGVLAALGFAAVVALSGRSGIGPQPVTTAGLGVALAIVAGVSISVNTTLCRRLNDAGVDPAALMSVRFVGAVVAAAALARELPALLVPGTLAVVVGASLGLIVLPNYVNQVGISLASPLTVRVVLAVGPALTFLLQLADGRLSSSPYSLGAAVFYGVFAIWAALARRRAISRAAFA